MNHSQLLVNSLVKGKEEVNEMLAGKPFIFSCHLFNPGPLKIKLAKYIFPMYIYKTNKKWPYDDRMAPQENGPNWLPVLTVPWNIRRLRLICPH